MPRIALFLLLAGVLAAEPLVAQRGGSPPTAGRQGSAGQPGPAAPAQGGRQGGAAQPGAGGAAGRAGGGRQVRDRAPSTGSGIIRGRVVAADTGAPIRRAQVQATVGGGRPYTVLTDTQGEFELRDLPAGSWTLRASKAGFVGQQFGQRGPFSSGVPLAVEDGRQVAADFALTRGGAITGRIFDEFGEPVAGVRVAALRVQWSTTGPRLSTSGPTGMTDDTGAYRVYGLAPGAYYVGASGGGGNGASSVSTEEGPVTYGTVYFPGTTDINLAQRVSVVAGQELPGTNLSYTPLPAVRIGGMILGANGLPTRATVRLLMPVFSDGPPAGQSSTNSAADGTFSLRNVSPGSYTLEVTARNAARGAAPEVASLPITVGTTDIDGLTITMTRGATVSGTISTENNARVEFSNIRVSASPLRAAQRPALPRAQAAADGTFELNGLIGPHAVRIEGLPAGWVVKSVTANGIDVSDAPLELRGTEQVSMRVVLTDRVTELLGTVRSDHASGAMVVVFPDDEAKWTLVSRHIRTARAGDAGQFSIRGLPPGTRYLAAALDYVENGEHLDPDFLERARSVASSFTLGEGEQKVLELPLITRQ